MIKISGLNLELRRFALRSIDLNIETGDYFMLVGPTGSGKTLLLETIAGLNKVRSGEIRIDEREITFIEPEKRDIGIVYQDSALFPHLSVSENIIFGLKVRHTGNQMIRKTLDEIVPLVGVGHLLDRKPVNLSGGEKQKVAVARALAIRPRLLLLDEPLSALDPESREGLQRELKRIHHELNITVIHVTHDLDEAMMLGKHIAVIGEGSIRQVGTPEEIFRRPNSEFVARFTMTRNILPGVLQNGSEGRSIFRSGNLEITASTPKEMVSYACIRPEDIALSTNLSSRGVLNSFTGAITGIEDRGTAFYVNADVQPELCCIIPRRNFNEMQLKIGAKVRITFDPNSVHLF